jgi:hypothetical protein
MKRKKLQKKLNQLYFSNEEKSTLGDIDALAELKKRMEKVNNLLRFINLNRLIL